MESFEQREHLAHFGHFEHIDEIGRVRQTGYLASTDNMRLLLNIPWHSVT